jgi:hypothetical protein
MEDDETAKIRTNPGGRGLKLVWGSKKKKQSNVIVLEKMITLYIGK